MNTPAITQPSTRKELSDETEFGTAAIATGAFSGAAVGTFVPVVGTMIGASVGAGFGFILGLIAKETNDSKKAGYQPLMGNDHDDEEEENSN